VGETLEKLEPVRFLPPSLHPSLLPSRTCTSLSLLIDLALLIFTQFPLPPSLPPSLPPVLPRPNGQPHFRDG
jgi:hypothetical protein